MIYYDVLNRKEKDLWDLAKYLATPNQVKKLTLFSRQLNLSDFTLEQRCLSLNETWQELFHEPLFKDTPDIDSYEIYVSDDQLLQFQKHLLSHSLGNYMLLYLLMDRYDLKEFTDRHGISQATAYRIRKEVQDAFNNYGIEIKNNQLSGDELTIRNIMNSILLIRQMDLKSLGGPEAFSAAEQSVTLVKNHFKLSLRLSEENLLMNVLFTAVIRYGNDHFLQTDPPIDPSCISDELLASIAEVIGQPPAAIQLEANNFMIFLYAFGFINELNFAPSPEYDRIKRLDDEFQTELKRIPTAAELPQEKIQERDNAFRQVHWRNHLFPIFFKGFGFFESKEWGEEFYPLYKRLDELYLKNEILAPGYLKAELDRAKLYIDYFYIWANFASDKTYMPKVYVCVDFSQNAVLENLIRQIFSNVWLSNLVVQNTLDEQTDLYLSDRHYDQLKIPAIVWTNPPSYRELLTLIKTAEAISIKKSQETDF